MMPDHPNIKANPQPVPTFPGKTSGKLSVNLLPPEIILQRKQGVKLSKSSRISISALLILIFFTSVTLTFRILQNSNLNNAQQNLAVAQEKINTLRSKEEQLTVLKNRLSSIKKLSGGDLKRKAIFNLVIFLTPSNITISEATIDQGGGMDISFNSSSLSSIEDLISSLGNPEKNSNLISSVGLESLSLGKDYIYRFELKIKPKDSIQNLN